MPSFAEVLDAKRARRSRRALEGVLSELAESLGAFLAARVTITGWTVDPTCTDNGVDIVVATNPAIGIETAGVLAFLHEYPDSASVDVFLLGFRDGERAPERKSQEFTLRLTPEGWETIGWGPDANLEWESYTNDLRWRRTPSPTHPWRNQHPETVARLSPQIERVRAAIPQGEAASGLAQALFEEGLGAIEITLVFKEATGASQPDLKAFSQWWGPTGVTNAHAFDAWARDIFGA